MTEHGPTDMHQSIEQWLVAKNILDGPALTAPEQQRQAELHPPPPPPSINGRRLSLKLPSLRPLNLRRRSLPVVGSPGVATEPRKRTRSTPTLPPSHTPSARNDLWKIPRSPRMTWAGLMKGFRSSTHKRSLSGGTDLGPVCEETPSTLELLPPVFSSSTCSIISGREERHSAQPSSAVSDPWVARLPVLRKPSVEDEEASDDNAIQLCDSPESLPQHLSTPIEENDVANTMSRPPTPSIAESIDPAYRALMPILHGLEAITENPRRTSISEEFNDDGYVQFWETFAQLSPKEILYAVYAIRGGALDVQFDTPSGHPRLVLLLALWALAATGFAVYMYSQPR
ncbi:hypothetical protein L226DRAFT_614617 [Lentinus tigrinus ALCF2SS1-7]|nr:hypothetical protein L226DRAFT_614617 [Lentinus tigrinus ALCF2SS1-7]